MSFASLATPDVSSVIERFAKASPVTLVVGAGASAEASLPSWRVLVERLLHRVAKSETTLADEESELAWVKRTLECDDLLAAAAIVEAMANDDLETALPAELYGPEGAGAVEPGPIVEQVAHLRNCYGEHVALLTTNYDDLIERALMASGLLKRDIRPYVSRRRPPAGVVGVTHLHGYAGRGGAPRKLVLTEGHYHRMQKGSSWQEECVTERLQSTSCLFVGTSLSDPNLVRYLYSYKQSSSPRHAAVFVREGDLDGDSSEVRTARERAVAKRWERCGVECVFVDHFGDAAQLLYEVAHRRMTADGYEPIAIRAERALTCLQERVVLCHAGQSLFAETQVQLSRWLRDTLESVLSLALAPGASRSRQEALALTLWLLSPDGRRITAWAHSDSAHQDPRTIDSKPVRTDSRWIAVRAVCKGVRVDQNPHNDLSRWRFGRALPLILDKPTRLPIGCLTLATTALPSAAC